jgi:hypothetical protein
MHSVRCPECREVTTWFAVADHGPWNGWWQCPNDHRWDWVDGRLQPVEGSGLASPDDR